MTVHDNFDRNLESWLNEGPNRLPERAVDRIVGEIERIDARRPAWLLRRETVNRLVLSFGGVAALVLVVIGAAYYIGPNGFGSASGTLYSSSRHGYTLRIPTTWTVNQIDGSWALGTVFDYLGPGSDQFVNPAEPGVDRFMNSQPLGAGMTPEQWTAQYIAVNKPFFGNCRDVAESPLRVGGVDGTILESDCSGTATGPTDAAQLTLVHAGRGYVFRVLSSDGFPDEKALLQSWVATLGWTDVTASP